MSAFRRSLLMDSGKILSGGQKARVSLARAVYSRASTILLDDVISAVDAQTSKHIVENCFASPLMQGRTIIIASHAVESLAPLAHHSIFLEDGKTVWTGPGKGLLESEHMKHLKTETAPAAGHEVVFEKNAPAGVDETAATEMLDKEKLEARRQSLAEPGEKADAANFEIKEAIPKTPKQLILEEKRDQGTVDFRHWRDLKKFNGTNLFWTGAIALLLVSTLLPVIEKSVLE